jgi:MFS family permease
MEASKQSLRALDLTCLLIADVKDGVGIYLSVFLLTVRHWQPDEIGIIMAIPGIVGIIVQPPAGALIDHTRYKRYILGGASIVIAACCWIIIRYSSFWPVAISQGITGIVQSVYAPCLAAITLGLVGQKLLPRRIGRNDTFNHAGNLAAAGAAGLIANYFSYNGVFWFSIFQCLGLAVVVLLIRERDIDHNLARGAAEAEKKEAKAISLGQLLKDRNILLFAAALMLFHLSNGSMLPLLGQKIGLQDPKHSAQFLSAAIIIAQGIMALIATYSGRRAEVSRKSIMLVAYILLPVRAVLFAFISNPYILTGLQVLDGIGAGIFGVVSVLMIADLSRGTGRFNVLQGFLFSAIGLALSLSSVLSGYIVRWFGYTTGFILLAVLGVVALLFFKTFVPETKDLHAEEGPSQPAALSPAV